MSDVSIFINFIHKHCFRYHVWPVHFCYVAVREAFTNAIIHCDLMADAGILRIEKHDDRLCFRNPGLLKLPVETIYRGGNSKARNPKIQNMLRMIGFGENVGSGFPKIIAAWKETNWGDPQLLNKLDVDEVELVLPVPSTKATSDTAPANAPVNAPANAPVKLNKTQSAIVKAMRNDNHITYEDLGTIVEVDRSTIRRNIAVLKEKVSLDVLVKIKMAIGKCY